LDKKHAKKNALTKQRSGEERRRDGTEESYATLISSAYMIRLLASILGADLLE
jgi:hypothetical protein